MSSDETEEPEKKRRKKGTHTYTSPHTNAHTSIRSGSKTAEADMVVSDRETPNNGDKITLVDAYGEIIGHGDMVEAEVHPDQLPEFVPSRHRVIGKWCEVDRVARLRGMDVDFKKDEVFASQDDGCHVLKKNARTLKSLVKGPFVIWHEYVTPRVNRKKKE